MTENDKNIEEQMTFSPALRNRKQLFGTLGFLDMISRHPSEHFVQIISLQIVIIFNNRKGD